MSSESDSQNRPGKAQAGSSGKYPMGTLMFYGPDRRTATKAVAAMIVTEGAEPQELKRWFSRVTDVREDPFISEEIAGFFKTRNVRHVVLSDGVTGCPHEEGIDYPLGEPCPQCPYWKHRNRWTGKLEKNS